jgi:DNA-binding response OmpR family regulator
MAEDMIKNVNPIDGSVFNISSEFTLKNQNNFRRPFRMADLLGKIRNFLDFLEKNIIFLDRLGKFNFRDRIVIIDEKNIPLTEKENELLYFIYKNKKVSRGKILKALWRREDDENSKVLETILYNLKQKLKEHSVARNLIVFYDGHYELGGKNESKLS